MRAQDIVNQLAIVLPSLVDDFTTQFNVSSLTRVGTTVTVETATTHGLEIGKQVSITGAQTPITCSILSDDDIATMTTDFDHDMTENAGFDVQIEGANESHFNGTFTLLSVPNRRTLIFQISNTGLSTATGAPLLLNGSNIFKTYNGLREITAVPTTTSFEYEITDITLFSPASGTIVAKISPRISSAVDFESLVAAYTKQDTDVAWLFVLLGDGVADKDRNIVTDSTSNIQLGNYFNQRLIQSVFIYVFLPTSTQIAGRASRDRCEELLKPICNSILSVRFPSLVENINNPLMFTGHGLRAYSSAFYVHQYTFEATLQFGPSDIFIRQDDVAFRDIDLTLGLDIGTETFETLIDLDDEPL